jgi:hypothetical protein
MIDAEQAHKIFEFHNAIGRSDCRVSRSRTSSLNATRKKQPPCIHLGPTIYRLHTRTTGCGGPIQLYRCDHFAEEVTRRPIAAEHVFILQDDGTATPKIRQRRRERGEPEIQEPGPHYRPNYHGRNCVSCPVRDRAARARQETTRLATSPGT